MATVSQLERMLSELKRNYDKRNWDGVFISSTLCKRIIAALQEYKVQESKYLPPNERPFK